jgi:hypothetical protein
MKDNRFMIVSPICVMKTAMTTFGIEGLIKYKKAIDIAHM